MLFLHIYCQQKAGNFMKLKALKTAFPYTIPIFTGFCFSGMAYGIYMNTAGLCFFLLFLISFIGAPAPLLKFWHPLYSC